jgi:hypothetical protein
LFNLHVALNLLFLELAASPLYPQTQQQTVDQILRAYIQALGGQSALDKINTREVHAKVHRHGKVTYFWAKPDKVLQLSHGEKIGFDGNSGWVLSRKKKLTKLPKADQRNLQTNANPVRYAHLKELYDELASQPSERAADRVLDVIISPNNIGSTKFYFDQVTHLLVRIDDFGVTSAYYKHSIEFSDYKNVDGIRLPFRIVYTTNEPGGKTEDIRISSVDQNIELKPEMFTKPRVAAVTLGGKR